MDKNDSNKIGTIEPSDMIVRMLIVALIIVSTNFEFSGKRQHFAINQKRHIC